MRATAVAVVLTLLLTWSSPAFAAEGAGVDSNSLVRLEDYLRYAALHNAGLEAKFEQWRAAVERIPQAEALPDPKFTYGYFIEEVETRVGPQRQRVGIMQVFPWFGKIEARTDAAAAMAKAARQVYQAEKLKLFYDVKDGFYEYAYLAKAVEIARENLELLEHFEEVARARYAVAVGTHPDVIRAQVELAKIEDVLTSLEELREPMTARLNAVLNRRGFEILPWPVRGELKQVDADSGEVIDALRAANPELAAIDMELEAAKYRVTVAKKNFWPDIGVGVDWIQTDKAIMPGVRDSGKDPVVLMFSMNLPIWRDSYKAGQREAEANVRKITSQRVETENTLLATALRVLYDYQDSERKVNLYGASLVPKAEELLGASESAYQAGTVDFLSLIDAQRTLLGFALMHERALTDSQQRLAELEMLAGAELPPAGYESNEGRTTGEGTR